MQKTSNISYPDFARLLVQNGTHLTEGEILDTLRQHGANDREIELSMDQVRDQLSDPQIDIDSPDASSFDLNPTVEKGATLDDLVEAPDLAGGMAMEGESMTTPFGVDGDLNTQQAESMPVEDLSSQDVSTLVSDYKAYNPDASQDEIDEYLLALGISQDELRGRLSKVAGVALKDAVEALLDLEPDIDTESLRERLRRFGIGEREIEEVVRALPPPEGGGGRDFYTPANQMKNTGAGQEDIMAFLEGEGASPEEQRAVQNSLARGSRVGGLTVVSVVDSELFGTHYKLENGEFVTHEQAMEREAAFKEADKRTRLEIDIDDYELADWDESSEEGTRDRLARVNSLLRDVSRALSQNANQRLASVHSKLVEDRQVLSHRLQVSEYPQGYLDNLPKFSVEVADRALPIGPAPDASWHEAVFESEDAVANIDWRFEVTAGADMFVEEIGPKLVGDSGEVRKLASRFIRAKSSHLAKEDATKIEKEFLANVEKARRAYAKVIVSQKTASADLPEESTDEGVFL